MTTSGRCLCGAISFQIEGETDAGWFCHCSKCRRNSGSAFQSAVACRKGQFRWLTGEGLAGEYSDGPDGYRTRFCTRCGSKVPQVSETYDYVWIPAGSLEAKDLDFQAHVYVGSKAPWFEITDDLPRHDER